jgi:hypothetical protein
VRLRDEDAVLVPDHADGAASVQNQNLKISFIFGNYKKNYFSNSFLYSYNNKYFSKCFQIIGKKVFNIDL